MEDDISEKTKRLVGLTVVKRYSIPDRPLLSLYSMEDDISGKKQSV